MQLDTCQLKKIRTLGSLTLVMSLMAISSVFGLEGGSSEYGGEILRDEGGKLKTLLGPVLGVGAMSGFVMGAFQAFKQSGLGPMATWFGIGAACFGGLKLVKSPMFTALIPF